MLDFAINALNGVDRMQIDGVRLSTLGKTDVAIGDSPSDRSPEWSRSPMAFNGYSVRLCKREGSTKERPAGYYAIDIWQIRQG
jgi:hypothetical protein